MGGFDQGSFKDPEGRVFEADGRIFRTLSEAARSRMESLFRDGTLPAFIDDGLVIPSRLVAAGEAGLDAGKFGPVVMEHERVPVLTYAYEWSFEMLRAAALVTLELLDRCLARDLVLKDATPFNLALVGGRMRFIDLLSIERYETGQPWDGYAQFCRAFLIPLMLTAYKGVAFQPWLRGAPGGIAPAELARLARPRDLLRRGVFKHVILQARLERSFAGQDAEIRGAFPGARFGKEMIRANVANLRRTVAAMTPRRAESAWTDYAATHSYGAQDAAAKRGFVQRALAQAGCRRVVDLGANTGEYAFLAAAAAECVIAADRDPACIDALFRRLADEPLGARVVPMVLDLTNPSPRQGWALAERRDVFERLEADGFLALALVHHICISGNVPLEGFAAILARLGRAGVVEWVDKRDAMVRRLLRNRPDVFADYDWENFKRALTRHFEIRDIGESHGGARRLCHVVAR